MCTSNERVEYYMNGDKLSKVNEECDLGEHYLPSWSDIQQTYFI